MHIRSGGTYELGAKRKTERARSETRIFVGSFYRTILCIYSFIIQENSLALNCSAGYSTDNNVTLDTVQCAYTIHIYKSTFARFRRLPSHLLSLSLVLSHTLSLSLFFRSLPLSRSRFSLLAPLKSELSFSRFLEIIVSYLNNKI